MLLKNKNSNLAICILVIVGVATGCKKFTEIDPPKNRVEGRLVFTDETTANAAILGIYGSLNTSGMVNNNLSVYSGLTSDELVRNNAANEYIQLMNNNIAINNSYTQTIWKSAYAVIAQTNVCLDGLATSTGISGASKNQFTGEAKFLRAYCHFYLTNLYGAVPLMTTGNWQLTDTIHRTPKSQVMAQVVNDLVDARQLLSASTAGTLLRVNKTAAAALLARAYLYQQNWVAADTCAASAILGSQIPGQPLPALNTVFLTSSKETIWQLQPAAFYKNALDLSLIYAFGSLNYYATDSLLKAFEPADLRQTIWLGKVTVSGKDRFYPYKYKSTDWYSGTTTEYNMMLRLAEQYLIRAEAKAKQNKVADAVKDLNVIRSRAGLTPLSESITQNACIAAVEQERRVELFAEWGHRWLDLTRLPSISGAAGKTRADDVLLPMKGSNNWQSTDILYPIPANDILKNTNLGPNNLGY